MIDNLRATSQGDSVRPGDHVGVDGPGRARPGLDRSPFAFELQGLCAKSRIVGPWFDRLTTNVASNPPFVLSLSKGNSRYAALLVQSHLQEYVVEGDESVISNVAYEQCGTPRARVSKLGG